MKLHHSLARTFLNNYKNIRFPPKMWIHWQTICEHLVLTITCLTVKASKESLKSGEADFLILKNMCSFKT